MIALDDEMLENFEEIIKTIEKITKTKLTRLSKDDADIVWMNLCPKCGGTLELNSCQECKIWYYIVSHYVG